jgi:positive regulator of sigma E activity
VVNNNKIIGRQQDSYESINTDYADIIQKQRKVKDADETSKLNIDLVNNYTAQTSYLLYIYPLLILILSIALLYLTYLTIMKFKANIYDKY